MHDSGSSYGLWFLVVVNSAVMILFAMSFIKPRTRADWRSLGAFSAFIVALFTEMYGFPLTVYVLSGWLGSWFPALDLSHDAGHLWYPLMGLKGNAHLNPIHIGSNVMIIAGFGLIWAAWRRLHAARQDHRLATAGPYARIRHPQYVGFVLIMLGFLVMWPTLPTLLMFPGLVWIYVRLARHEDRAVREEYPAEWARWAAKTPPFIPALWARTPPAGEADNPPEGGNHGT